jgi:hypothetical protein
MVSVRAFRHTRVAFLFIKQAKRHNARSGAAHTRYAG